MALTKVELAEALMAKGFDKQAAKLFIDQFFDEIRKTLASGEEVKLSGFGNFTLREKKARPGRTPKRGQLSTFPVVGWLVLNPGKKIVLVLFPAKKSK